MEKIKLIKICLEGIENWLEESDGVRPICCAAGLYTQNK
jgi:hypothetical protein